MTGLLAERYDDRIAGVLSCYDRVVVTGTLSTVCYAAGMTKFLYAIGVRIFDYPPFGHHHPVVTGQHCRRSDRHSAP